MNKAKISMTAQRKHRKEMYRALRVIRGDSVCSLELITKLRIVRELRHRLQGPRVKRAIISLRARGDINY